MKMTALFLLGAGAIALAVSPAFAKPPHHSNGSSHHAAGATGSTGATGPTGPSGNAYGYYCQNQSKKHVAGQKGTPFSQCVTAMAKLKSGKTHSPAVACAKMSKTHTPGQPGTPYSRCVSAGAKLLENQQHP